MITVGHIPFRYVSLEYKWMMLFIPASLLKSLLYFTLCSSWASCLLRRVHVAFSHRFLGSDGSCCGPVPLGPHVSMVPPSLAWGSKLSVHSPWKVTVEAPLSSSLVTGMLLLTLCALLCQLCWNSHRSMEIFVQSPNLSQVQLVFKNNNKIGSKQHSCCWTPWASWPPRGHAHFSAHWLGTPVSTVALMSFAKFPSAILEPWSGALRGEQCVWLEIFYTFWNLNKCVYFIFKKEKYTFYWLHSWWKIASNTSQWSYIFNFWLRREMSGQALEFINLGIDLEV